MVPPMLHDAPFSDLLRIDVSAPSAHADAVDVRLSGEVDISCADRIPGLVGDVRPHSAGPVRLDVTDLTFCDARGLAALIDLKQRLGQEQQRPLLINGVRPNLYRLLLLTGLVGLLLEGRDAALARS